MLSAIAADHHLVTAVAWACTVVAIATAVVWFERRRPAARVRPVLVVRHARTHTRRAVHRDEEGVVTALQPLAVGIERLDTEFRRVTHGSLVQPGARDPAVGC